MNRIVLGIGLSLLSCAAQPAPPAAAAPEPGPPPASFLPEAAPQPVETAVPGRDKEHPVPACGPRESYAYVAGTYQCPEGGNPLGGNLEAGRDARRGNVGPHGDPEASVTDFNKSHIVDVYSIPCPSGPQQVFVCMYHCPPARSVRD